MITIENGKAVLNNWLQRCSNRTPLLRSKKSTKKTAKRRTGKLSGDITAAEVLESMEHDLEQRDYSIRITGDSRMMPLFLGYKVLAEGRKDVCGIVSFNQREKKCEISSACIGTDENTVWTVRFGDCFCKREEKNFKVSEIDDVLASRLDDCELVFDAFYEALLFNLKHHNYTDLTEEEYGGFMKEIKQEKNARKIIIDIFVLPLLFEDAVEAYPLLFIPLYTACFIRIRYEGFVYRIPESEQAFSVLAWSQILQAGIENSGQMIRKFEKAVKCSIFYADAVALLKGFGRSLDGFYENDFEIPECSVEELLDSLEAGMNDEGRELMKTHEEQYDIVFQNVLAVKNGVDPELWREYSQNNISE